MVTTQASRSSIRNTGDRLDHCCFNWPSPFESLVIIHHKIIRTGDAWLASCYIFLLVLAILCLLIVPAFFRLTVLAEGIIEPYSTANNDALPPCRHVSVFGFFEGESAVRSGSGCLGLLLGDAAILVRVLLEEA